MARSRGKNFGTTLHRYVWHAATGTLLPVEDVSIIWLTRVEAKDIEDGSPLYADVNEVPLKEVITDA